MPILTTRGRRIFGAVDERGKRVFGVLGDTGRDVAYGTTQPPAANYNPWYLSFDGVAQKFMFAAAFGEWAGEYVMQVDAYPSSVGYLIVSAGAAQRVNFNTDGTVNTPSGTNAYVDGVQIVNNVTQVPLGRKFTLRVEYPSVTTGRTTCSRHIVVRHRLSQAGSIVLSFLTKMVRLGFSLISRRVYLIRR